MLSRCAFLAFAATVAPLVAAHGHMSGAFVDDVYVPGPQPNSGPGDFAIRQINDINPVKDASNPDLFCGHGSTPATLTVNATQGSVLKFAWNNGDNGPWVHNTGPVMTYMASCGSGGCANFNDPNAEFFKISELGRKADGTWTMADLNSELNATTSATIPTFLPDGEYLVRHELIAMQLAMTEGGVEFYPACLQVRLSGGSTTESKTLPSGDQVANFPGAYHNDDPGLWDPNVYNGETAAEYTFPGPPLVTGASTDPSTGSTSSTDVPANTSGNPSSTSDSPAATTTPGCGNMSKKKKRVVKRIIRQGSLVKKSHRVVKKAVNENRPNLADWKRENNQPVARSRVMRGI